MQTDLTAVRQYLEGAWLQVRGDDELACEARDALDYLIEKVAAVECSRPQRQAKISSLPGRGRARTAPSLGVFKEDRLDRTAPARMIGVEHFLGARGAARDHLVKRIEE